MTALMERAGSLWYADECTRTLLLRNRLDTLDRLLGVSAGESLTKRGLPSWRHRRRLELTDEHGHPHTFYLKTYLRPPFRTHFKRWCKMQFGHATAWTEWNWMRRLRELGIPAVEPAALGERMIGPFEMGSALLAAEVPGQSLETLAANPHARISGRLIDALADLVARLHRNGLIHRDLYLCHVFVDASENLRLIDLGRMICPRWGQRRWWIKDLAALNYSAPPWFASRCDRLRFLRRYLMGMNSDHAASGLARDIVARTRRMARHDARKGRIQSWQRMWRSGVNL